MRGTDLNPGAVVACEGYLRTRATYLGGDTWNGWAMPYFDADAVRALVAEINGKPEWFGTASFDERMGTVSVTEVDADEPWEMDAVEIDGRFYWAVGAGAWVWQVVEEGPDASGLRIEYGPATPRGGLFTRDIEPGDAIRVPDPATGTPVDVRVIGYTPTEGGKRLHVTTGDGLDAPRWRFETEADEVWPIADDPQAVAL